MRLRCRLGWHKWAAAFGPTEDWNWESCRYCGRYRRPDTFIQPKDASEDA